MRQRYSALPSCLTVSRIFFFFNDTATTEIYTLSLHDALPICRRRQSASDWGCARGRGPAFPWSARSEEHTSELQSRSDLVCRLLLEKKKQEFVHAPVYCSEWGVDQHWNVAP